MTGGGGGGGSFVSSSYSSEVGGIPTAVVSSSTSLCSTFRSTLATSGKATCELISSLVKRTSPAAPSDPAGFVPLGKIKKCGYLVWK